MYIEEVPIEHPANAYCVSYFGLYTRIVFISSLIGGYYGQNSVGLTLDELEGIFAHEVGHWMRSHNETNVTFYNMLYEPLLFAMAMWLREQKVVYEAFHFSSTDTDNLPYPLLPGLFIAQQIVLRMPDEVLNLRNLLLSYFAMFYYTLRSIYCRDGTLCGTLKFAIWNWMRIIMLRLLATEKD